MESENLVQGPFSVVNDNKKIDENDENWTKCLNFFRRHILISEKSCYPILMSNVLN